jgi:hypothetical protein
MRSGTAPAGIERRRRSPVRCFVLGGDVCGSTICGVSFDADCTRGDGIVSTRLSEQHVFQDSMAMRGSRRRRYHDRQGIVAMSAARCQGHLDHPIITPRGDGDIENTQGRCHLGLTHDQRRRGHGAWMVTCGHGSESGECNRLEGRGGVCGWVWMMC